MKIYDTDEEKRIDMDDNGYTFYNPTIVAEKKNSVTGNKLTAKTTIRLLLPNLRTTELNGTHCFLRAEQDGIWNFLNIKEGE